MNNYKTTVGIEVHAELKTKTKIKRANALFFLVSAKKNHPKFNIKDIAK